jgi:hypothetical protein
MLNERYNSGQERFFVYAMVQKNKVMGNYTKKDFIVACRQYLELHPARVKSIQQKYEKGYNGKVQAMKECIFDLYRKYYGNKVEKLESVNKLPALPTNIQNN